jgi:hypothetical protein
VPSGATPSIAPAFTAIQRLVEAPGPSRAIIAARGMGYLVVAPEDPSHGPLPEELGRRRRKAAHSTFDAASGPRSRRSVRAARITVVEREDGGGRFQRERAPRRSRGRGNDIRTRAGRRRGGRHAPNRFRLTPATSGMLASRAHGRARAIRDGAVRRQPAATGSSPISRRLVNVRLAGPFTRDGVNRAFADGCARRRFPAAGDGDPTHSSR